MVMALIRVAFSMVWNLERYNVFLLLCVSVLVGGGSVAGWGDLEMKCWTIRFMIYGL